MGGFTSIVPMAASVLQTGQRISANQTNAQSRIDQTEAARQAELAEIAAREREDATNREEDLRRRQATARARQGASGLMAGGGGIGQCGSGGLRKSRPAGCRPECRCRREKPQPHQPTGRLA